MKNVLYIGPYEDTNGLGYSSRRYINALLKNNNINLSIRPIFITNSAVKNPISLPDQYATYSSNIFPYYDIVIQHGYPEMFVYDKRFGKHIGIVEVETANIQRSGWINRINLLDEIFVNSIHGLNSLYDCGVIKPIRVIAEPYDTPLFNEKLSPFFSDISENNKPFIFYTIGAYSEKKNIKGIILAYLLEFNSLDNVRLVIKTNSYINTLQDLDSQMNFDIKSIKSAIRKNNYPDINIVAGYISDEDIVRLHQSSDCYINAVKADGDGSSAIESMLCDNIVINTKNIGSSTYFNSGNALMVDSISTNVYSPTYANPNILTIHERWHEPNILSLQSQMRKAYSFTGNEKQSLVQNYQKNIFDQHQFNSIIV